MSERDDPFLDLGYTSPDDAVELRDARLDKQKIDKVTTDQARESKRRPRPTGHVRGFYEGEKTIGEEFPSTGEQSAKTPEEMAHTAEWVEKIRRSMGDSAIQRIMDRVDSEIPIDPDNVAKSREERERMKNARLRTYFDKKEARGKAHH